ncbi:MAG: hypothetical protein JWO05_1273 [Gemmatimonadetes bacterium]|nr:hypothetical protein [Gemmatimonadota bacterium]
MEIVLLVAILVLSLAMIPLGLPGTWLMVGAALGYQILVPQGGVGTATVVFTAILAVVGEVIEFSLSARYARKYGGSRRAGWGAIIGGTVGAFVGVPVPIIGPVIGAFAGAFLGALAGELTVKRDAGNATRVAWGALIGRVLASAVKVGIGVAISAWIVIAALT